MRNRNWHRQIPQDRRGPALVSYLSRWIGPSGAIKSFRQYIRYATSFGTILKAITGQSMGKRTGHTLSVKL